MCGWSCFSEIEASGDFPALLTANWSTVVYLNLRAGTWLSNRRSISPKVRSLVSGRRNQHQMLHKRLVPA